MKINGNFVTGLEEQIKETIYTVNELNDELKAAKKAQTSLLKMYREIGYDDKKLVEELNAEIAAENTEEETQEAPAQQEEPENTKAAKLAKIREEAANQQNTEG